VDFVDYGAMGWMEYEEKRLVECRGGMIAREPAAQMKE
jgi:hypothetical protein